MLSPKTTAVQILSLGRRPYAEVWNLQRQLLSELVKGEGPETLIVCEHFPVITAGKSTKWENLLTGKEKLRELGIEVFEVERGGDVTYHGPGQVVAYPIVDLRTRNQDVGWYMRSLEEIILQTLSANGIQGLRVPGKTGVWTQAIENSEPFVGRKIASMGVKLTHWCTMHGLALNVQDCTAGFEHLNPCGYTNIHMTSMQQETGRVFNIDHVSRQVIEKFNEMF